MKATVPSESAGRKSRLRLPSYWLIGCDCTPPMEARDTGLNRRFNPWLCLPMHLVTILGALWVLTQNPWRTGLLWLASLANVGGGMVIDVGRGLVHRKSKLEHTAGGPLLVMSRGKGRAPGGLHGPICGPHPLRLALVDALG